MPRRGRSLEGKVLNYRKSLATSVALALLCAPVAFASDDDDNSFRVPESHHHKQNPHVGLAPPAGSTGVVTPPITYHGGALINAPVIYYIWYGNWNQGNGTDTPQGQQILVDFANSIGGSGYFAINTTYSTNGYNITGGVTFGGQTSDAYSQGSRLSDSKVLTVVNNAIKNKKIPYDPNGVYFVLTSSDVAEISGFCSKYCGWHTAATPSSGHIRFSFVGNASRCLSGCAIQTVGPNGNAGVDGMVSVVAHELEEATTDADPSSGWVDSQGAENADKCAWTFGQNQQQLVTGAYYNVTLGGRNYEIQRNLKHSASGDTCNMDLTHQ
jgi:hypothetical protein